MKIQRKLFLLFVILTAIVLNTDCSGQSSKAEDKTGNETGKYKVTFIELGSVPYSCQQMQPIMKSVEEIQ